MWVCRESDIHRGGTPQDMRTVHVSAFLILCSLPALAADPSIVNHAGYVAAAQTSTTGYYLEPMTDAYLRLDLGGGRFATPVGMNPLTRNLVFRASTVTGQERGTVSLAKNSAGQYMLVSGSRL